MTLLLSLGVTGDGTKRSQYLKSQSLYPIGPAYSSITSQVESLERIDDLSCDKK